MPLPVVLAQEPELVRVRAQAEALEREQERVPVLVEGKALALK